MEDKFYAVIDTNVIVSAVDFAAAWDTGGSSESLHYRLPARYSIAYTGQRGTLRMLVLTAGMSHKRKMDARNKENQIT